MNPKWKIKQLYTGAGIYQFTCNITGMKYVGKSKNCKERYGWHIAPSNKITSKIIITAGDFSYDILERLPLDVSDELLADREQYWMDQVPSEFLVNINRAKYPGDKAYHAAYHAANKDKILAQMAAYRAEHRDETAAYNAAYRAEHRDDLNAKAGEKIECECGSTYSRGVKSHHIKTKKHNDFINKI